MSERNRLIISSLCILGPRNAELRGLLWQDVGLGSKARMRVIGKFDRERRIPIPQTLVPLYRHFQRLERLRGRGQLDDPIFNGHPHSNPQKPAKALGEQAIRDIVADVFSDRVEGFEKITPHMLRHAALTAWVAGGADSFSVAYLGGHRRIQTAYDWYVAPNMAQHAAAIEQSPLAVLAINGTIKPVQGADERKAQ